MTKKITSGIMAAAEAKTEYVIQAYNVERWGNKWVYITNPKYTYEAAVAALNTLKEYEINHQSKRYKTKIDTYRILKRNVGEWETIE